MKWRAGKHQHTLFWWDWFDGSISIREVVTDTHAEYRQIFALWPWRCYACNGWTLGCGKHWGCGYCKACKAKDMSA